MAKGQAVKSLDEFVQENRKRKRAEELAQSIFGSGKRSSTGSSLSSRGAITKLTAAGAALNARVAADRQLISPPHQGKRTARRNHSVALATNGLMLAAQAVLEEHQRSHAPNIITPRSEEIRIKGAAGPYIVVAENLAVGTSAADIEIAMAPVGGEVVSCAIVARSPICTAEVAFRDKLGADAVIDKFHNKKADGRLLRAYYKNEDSTPRSRVSDGDMEVEDVKAESVVQQYEEPPLDKYPDAKPAYDDRRAENKVPADRYDYTGVPARPSNRGGGDGDRWSNNTRRGSSNNASSSRGYNGYSSYNGGYRGQANANYDGGYERPYRR